MPPSSTKRKINPRLEVKEEELVFDCEWEKCAEHFADIRDFLRHVGKHIHEYVASADDHANCFSCCWRECGSQILGTLHDFNRHVYFHAFHVKLKCVGGLLIKKGKFPECSTTGQSRNWIPELPENLQCGWTQCGAVCDNPVIFYCHVNQHCEEYPNGHNVQGIITCRWSDCDARFKTKYKLMEHLRSHTQEKVVACPTCGGLFANRTKFYDHLTRQKESSVYYYQCSHCNKKFATERLLRDHMRHHVNHYKCPFCDMTCPAPSSLRSHIKYRHTMEKPFKCAHCDHCAKSAYDLRRHMESHSSDSVFRCNINKCEYTARSYSSLTNHYKREHQIQGTALYACHICDLRVTRGSQMTKHLKKQHKFKWPPGHSRFRYKIHEDGTYRLQTIRYESIEVTETEMDQETDQETDQEMKEDDPSQDEVQESENEENNDPTTPMSVPDPDPVPTNSSPNSRGQLSSINSNLSCVKSEMSSSCSSVSEEHASETLISMPSIESSSITDASRESSFVRTSRSKMSMSEESDDVSGTLSSTYIPSEPSSQTLLSMPCIGSFTSLDTKESIQSSTQASSHGVQSRQASEVQSSSAISFTFVSDPGSGEMSVQKLSVDKNGILVFNENSQNNSGARSVAQTVTSSETQQNESYVDVPALAHDSDAYNLEMLGHVALLGQSLPTPRS